MKITLTILALVFGLCVMSTAHAASSCPKGQEYRYNPIFKKWTCMYVRQQQPTVRQPVQPRQNPYIAPDGTKIYW
jgi:hypothetical protein